MDRITSSITIESFVFQNMYTINSPLVRLGDSDNEVS